MQRVDPGGVVSRSIDPARVIGCVTYPATELVEPGVVRHVEGTRFAIGEPDGSTSERCRAVAGAFTAGGLKCPIEAQVREQLWLKLVGNVAFNPTTTVTGALLGELALAPEPTALARGLMEECARVGDVLGITMPVSIDRRLEAGIAVGDHRTSMLQDFEDGKPLEIDCLTGAVIEIAELLGVEVPQTRAIDAVVRLKTILRDRAATHWRGPGHAEPGTGAGPVDRAAPHPLRSSGGPRTSTRGVTARGRRGQRRADRATRRVALLFNAVCGERALAEALKASRHSAVAKTGPACRDPVRGRSYLFDDRGGS